VDSLEIDSFAGEVRNFCEFLLGKQAVRDELFRTDEQGVAGKG
jgi:hypothetical protein